MLILEPTLAQERRDLIRWLTTIQYENHHKTMGKGVLKDSGEWLFRKKEFLEWRAESWSSILWLRGIPGSGKSKLTCLAIDRFLKEKVANIAAAPVAYFYCIRSTSEPERADPDEIMRSLLKQLSCSGTKLPVREPLASRYKELKEKAEDDGSQEPPKLNLEECVELILGLLDHNPATIVIDALDECDPLRRHELLLALKDIIQKSANIVKVFVSSRDDNDIVCQLEDTPNVYIRASDNKEDITRFINNEVDWSIKNKLMLSGKVPKELKNRIVDTLTEGAQGMFRWVSLQIQNLCDSQRMKLESDIRAELGRLPKSLRESYDIVFQRIKDAGTASQQVAERAVKWLLCSHRPLKVQEIVAAVSVDSERQYTSLDAYQLLDVCCNLIVLDEESHILRFAHLSVREYFEQLPGYSGLESHVMALERCIDIYLASSKLEADSAISAYAKQYLQAHFASLGDNRPSVRAVRKIRSFLVEGGNVAPAFNAWLSDANSDDKVALLEEHKTNRAGWSNDLRKLTSSPPSPLFFVCSTECLWIMHEIWTLGKEFWTVKNSEGYSCFSYAVAVGFAPMVQILLKCGVGDINSKEGDYGWTPLLLAIENGHDSVTRLLLEHENIDVNAADDAWGQPPLAAAIKNQNEAVIRLLLARKDIDVNARDRCGCSSLWYAVPGARESLLELLLGRKDFDINMKDTDGRPLLIDAIMEDSPIFATHLLLSREDLDINSRDNLGRSPLLMATRRNQTEIAQHILLRKGVDVDARDSENGLSPLMVASWHGNEQVVRRILDYGASIDVTDNEGRTALSFAAEGGHEMVAQVLVEHKGNINIGDCHNQTPLLWATKDGREAVVKLLLERDDLDDVNVRGEFGQTPLLEALKGENLAVVQLLLRHKDISLDISDDYGRKPLDWFRHPECQHLRELLPSHLMERCSGRIETLIPTFEAAL